ncbi:MAG: CoA transferase [Actinobacteria bacterium]|nr:MAG: CoA transferase [Actinomycetota bacterium]
MAGPGSRTRSHGAGALLEGIRVLDLSTWRPGPYATQLLVELGADVVKVEPPGGDPMRVFPTLFAVLNAGKRAVAVDLKDAAGRAAVLERTASADVVVEGFRPGVVDRLGVGEDAVRAGNPSVVYCSVSGYGQDGPLRLLPGHDLNYQAWAGVVEPRPGDDTPVVGRPPIADLAGGCYAALAICAALVRRLRRDEGERIDVSMTDILATWTGALPPLTLPDGRSLGELPGYGTFATADGGWIALGVLSEDGAWRDLVRALGLDDAAALDFAERLALGRQLNERIVKAVGSRGRDEVVAALVDAGVPVSPVLSQHEMLEAELFRARGTVADGPDGAPVMCHPVRYDRHPAQAPRDAPPLTTGVGNLPPWL